MDSLKTTPLDALHRDLGGRMVPFAGYAMPLQFEGIMREHEWTRSQASLFDVSHMGQVVVAGPGAAAALEALAPADLRGLALNRQTYSLLLNEEGGVRDDLIITRLAEERFLLVVNAACKADDLAYLESRLPDHEVTLLEDHALLALQGPRARSVLAEVVPSVAGLPFLHGEPFSAMDARGYLTCSGYTGEDGFELSLPGEAALALAGALLEHEGVAAAGLGARDSLRLEAGLCLYGHELGPKISPVDAGLGWVVARRRRREGAEPGGFVGAEALFERQRQGPGLRRVGLTVSGKRPVREGQIVLDAEGREVGRISSASVSPGLGAPIAMAFVTPELAAPGTLLSVDARGRTLEVRVTALPFVAPRYFRG